MTETAWINGLRGLSSLWVFFIHFLPFVHPLLRPYFLFGQKWNICVPLFFVLSGRVNAISILNGKNDKGLIAVNRCMKRGSRLLVPLITIMILDYSVLHVFPIKSFTEVFDPIWFLFDGMAVPKNITWVAWTLQIEWHGSILVYFLGYILSQTSQQKGHVILLLSYLWSQLTHSWNTHFIFGLWLAFMDHHGTLINLRKSTHFLKFKLVLFVLAVLVSCQFNFINFEYSEYIDRITRSFMFSHGKWLTGTQNGHEESFTVFLLTATLVFCVETTSFLSAVFSIREFQFLGKISFSLYILHVYGIYLFGIQSDAFLKLQLPNGSWFAIALSIFFNTSLIVMI